MERIAHQNRMPMRIVGVTENSALAQKFSIMIALHLIPQTQGAIDGHSEDDDQQSQTSGR
jgi:hypothetical protein